TSTPTNSRRRSLSPPAWRMSLSPSRGRTSPTRCSRRPSPRRTRMVLLVANVSAGAAPRRLTECGSAHAPAFRRGVSASSDSETCYTVNYERQGCEAGVQVPLLPDPRASRAVESDVRLCPLRLQPGARGATPGVDAGAAQGHPRGDRPDAYRLETRPRHGMAGRAVEGTAASIPPQSAIGVRQVLAQTEPLPEVQEEGQ